MPQAPFLSFPFLAHADERDGAEKKKEHERADRAGRASVPEKRRESFGFAEAFAPPTDRKVELRGDAGVAGDCTVAGKGALYCSHGAPRMFLQRPPKRRETSITPVMATKETNKNSKHKLQAAKP